MDFLLPDWVPNIHPMVVHFPIALLVTAALLDIAALIFRSRVNLARLTTFLFVAGAICMLGVWFSGRSAADSLMVSGDANTILTDHADWATFAVWYFGIYGLLRLVLWRLHFRLGLWIPLMVLGIGGIVLIAQTSHLGARMVFEQGVGVAKVAALENELSSLEQELARFKGQASSPVIEEDGSWSWMPDLNAREAFEEGFEVWAGEVAASARQDSATGQVYLALSPVSSPAMVIFNVPLESVEFDLALDISGFDGDVRVVHHVEDSSRYDYMQLGAGQARLGRLSADGDQVYDQQPFSPSGLSQLRVTCDRTHVRAYADGVLIAHGHGPAPATGPVGIMLSGAGTVLVGALRATALR